VIVHGRIEAAKVISYSAMDGGQEMVCVHIDSRGQRAAEPAASAAAAEEREDRRRELWKQLCGLLTERREEEALALIRFSSEELALGDLEPQQTKDDFMGFRFEPPVHIAAAAGCSTAVLDALLAAGEREHMGWCLPY
jgi:hypothetical protein